MATRAERLQALERAAKEYLAAERTRLTNEVAVLEDVLRGRTGGLGIQSGPISYVEGVAQNDLKSILFPQE